MQTVPPDNQTVDEGKLLFKEIFQLKSKGMIMIELKHHHFFQTPNESMDGTRHWALTSASITVRDNQWKHTTLSMKYSRQKEIKSESN